MRITEQNVLQYKQLQRYLDIMYLAGGTFAKALAPHTY